MIVELRSSTDPWFESLLELAHRLFPPEVLEPDEELRAEVDGRSRVPYRYLAALDEALVGFVRFACLEMGVGFVVHIGVAPERQGRGDGSRLLDAARMALGVAVVVAEVEEGPPLEWWTRRGAEVVSAKYVQPPLRTGGAAVPLNLVALGPWRAVPSLVERFYGEVWGLGADDALVRQAVTA